jgi:hypothetical protein
MASCAASLIGRPSGAQLPAADASWEATNIALQT